MRCVIIGSSTPLQKTLPVFTELPNASLVAVFLDENNDTQSIHWCKENQVPYYSDQLLKTDEANTIFSSLAFDWIFSINSTVIIRESLLKIPESGALNLHPGKLPEYAGLHTHQWAIRNGEKEFGVTIHHISSGIDTGNIAWQTNFALGDNETGLSLYLKCMNEGTRLFQFAIREIISGHEVPSIPQDLSKRKIYTTKMASDGVIDWHQSSNDILNFIRAANYEPFKSPTYNPTCFIQNKPYFAVKASRSDIKCETGKYLFTDGKIIFGSGDGSLQIDKLKDQNGKVVSITDIFQEQV